MKKTENFQKLKRRTTVRKVREKKATVDKRMMYVAFKVTFFLIEKRRERLKRKKHWKQTLGFGQKCGGGLKAFCEEH